MYSYDHLTDSQILGNLYESSLSRHANLWFNAGDPESIQEDIDEQFQLKMMGFGKPDTDAVISMLQTLYDRCADNAPTTKLRCS